MRRYSMVVVLAVLGLVLAVAGGWWIGVRGAVIGASIGFLLILASVAWRRSGRSRFGRVRQA